MDEGVACMNYSNSEEVEMELADSVSKVPCVVALAGDTDTSCHSPGKSAAADTVDIEMGETGDEEKMEELSDRLEEEFQVVGHEKDQDEAKEQQVVGQHQEQREVEQGGKDSGDVNNENERKTEMGETEKQHSEERIICQGSDEETHRPKLPMEGPTFCNEGEKGSARADPEIDSKRDEVPAFTGSVADDVDAGGAEALVLPSTTTDLVEATQANEVKRIEVDHELEADNGTIAGDVEDDKAEQIDSSVGFGGTALSESLDKVAEQALANVPSASPQEQDELEQEQQVQLGLEEQQEDKETSPQLHPDQQGHKDQQLHQDQLHQEELQDQSQEDHRQQQTPQLPRNPGARTRVGQKRSQACFYKEVQDFVCLICDSTMMSSEIEEAGVDLSKMPLEKIERSVIREGLTWLKALEREMQKPCPSADSIKMLTKSFFKSISFRETSRQLHIDTREVLKAKVVLLETFIQIDAVHKNILKLEAGGGRRKISVSMEARASSEATASPELKPATPYFVWFNENRSKIMEELGDGYRMPDVAKRGGQIWKELPEEVRARYDQPFRIAKEKYDVQKRAEEARKAAIAEAADPLIDRLYRMLNCNISVLPCESRLWRGLAEYLRTTQPIDAGAAEETARYAKVLRIFSVSRHGDDERYAKHRGAENRMLLWYGMPLAAWAGTLAQGLRTPSVEAPIAEYRYGKGLYFTDMACNALDNCAPCHASGQRGILLLAEVALGHCRTLQAPDPSPDRVPKGYNGTICRGRITPDPAKTRMLPDGVRVPLGPPPAVTSTDAPQLPACAPPYNVFVAHDTSQVRMRHLVEVLFLYGADAVAASEIDEAAAVNAAVEEAAAYEIAAKAKAEAAEQVAREAFAARATREAAAVEAEAAAAREAHAAAAAAEIAARQEAVSAEVAADADSDAAPILPPPSKLRRCTKKTAAVKVQDSSETNTNIAPPAPRRLRCKTSVS
eukprot:TRINITY_DN67450_c0_g1_i1.p1 TRINITY_DN67450_c0_g1~~TRINITY_DN67450_c0_g1_i1.p1  ORF type:complete len:980 (+),score=203.01 TRINITY_DN67450_c0_g1_i1:59-2941(+)